MGHVLGKLVEDLRCCSCHCLSRPNFNTKSREIKATMQYCCIFTNPTEITKKLHLHTLLQKVRETKSTFVSGHSIFSEYWILVFTFVAVENNTYTYSFTREEYIPSTVIPVTKCGEEELFLSPFSNPFKKIWPSKALSRP